MCTIVDCADDERLAGRELGGGGARNGTDDVAGAREGGSVEPHPTTMLPAPPSSVARKMIGVPSQRDLAMAGRKAPPHL